MVELEIDGKKVEVAEGSTLMDAATQLGLYVPHFCYHKKLSIAANCRMCLVEVEKAPKPLPACATPVAAGMKVYTQSEKARLAQKSVMEFLLINHPLDCPICDQGGECQLQDLAVGYGPSASRFTEEKRVVFHKSMGPLISAEEMSRCIHCTRCVRFGQEIAGVMELGMAGRGEHAEIMSFVGSAVESELSGNMIDICPVGALTSKPFRYSARTWELVRRRSISPHDSIGANLVVQVKDHEVRRVVPLENEAVNECWISDRDRFSYEGLQSDDRLLRPMVKDGQGVWQETSWEEALALAGKALRSAGPQGASQLRSLAAPTSSLEELGLLAKLTRALQSDAIDFRPRLGAAGFDQDRSGPLTLGMPLSAVGHLERILVVGSFLRKDHPLLAQRLRQAVRHGAKLMSLHAVAEDLLMPQAAQMLVAPQDWVSAMAEVAVAAAQLKAVSVPEALSSVRPSAQASRIAALLAEMPSGSGRAAVFLGNSVLAHPEASLIWANAQFLSDTLGLVLGFTVEGGNGVGGYLAKAVPEAGGHDAASMFTDAAKVYLLLRTEPSLDAANTHQAVQALKAADDVIALAEFKGQAKDYATIMLPIAPFTETSGSYVNCEGRLQTAQAVVRPRGEARPAWKVLRVLGNLLGAEGFDADSSEDIRVEMLGDAAHGDLLVQGQARCRRLPAAQGRLAASEKSGLVRVADVPIYRSDSLLRHADALQQTRASLPPSVRLNAAELQRLGMASGGKVSVQQKGKAAVVMDLLLDPSVAPGTALIATAHELSASLGDMIGPVDLESV